ncbi:mechanosensitive ion channel family protein [Sorangium sp. So ce726]|uniref:mechanosensitive ion channel family protein n=1 Tax=Sorangium sp. So ce726 TaxID=3133319 RepID=UPI003F6222CC
MQRLFPALLVALAGLIAPAGAAFAGPAQAASVPSQAASAPSKAALVPSQAAPAPSKAAPAPSKAAPAPSKAAPAPSKAAPAASQAAPAPSQAPPAPSQVAPAPSQLAPPSAAFEPTQLAPPPDAVQPPLVQVLPSPEAAAPASAQVVLAPAPVARPPAPPPAPVAPASAPVAPLAPAAAVDQREPAAPDPQPSPPVVEQPEARVELLGRTVFALRVHRGSLSPPERAREAARVLEGAAQEKAVPEVRIDEQDGVAVVYVGDRPLVHLGPEDAAAAGHTTVAAHAAAVAGTVRDVLAKEQSRSRLATSVFSFSLLVFSGLIALLLLRKVGELVARGRAWVAEHPERLPALHVRGIEMLRPAASQGALSVALGAAGVLVRLGIAYIWILFALSLFASTRGTSEKLTGFVLAPMSELMGRIARSVPVLVLAILATLAVIVLIRFVGLFFGSVGRGETSLGWLPSDLAVATGVLVRFGILVAALLLAAPLITGTDEGALTRIGFVVLAAAGLASTPLIASAAVGLSVIYGRRLRVGDIADVGGRAGRVRELTLIEARLEDEDGCVVRVPHLLSLFHPTRIRGRPPVVAVEISVDPAADLDRVRELLVKTGSGLGSRARAALVAIDEGGAHFRATMACDGDDVRSRWLTAVAQALAAADIPLGRAPASSGGARRAAPAPVDRSAAS